MEFLRTYWLPLAVATAALLAISVKPDEVAQGLARVLRAIGAVPRRVIEWVQVRCAAGMSRLVREDESEHETGAGWIARRIVSHVLHGALAAAVALGSASLEMLRGALVAFGIPAGSAPIAPWLAIALVIVGVPALWGALLLEALAWTRGPWRLFPTARTGPKGPLLWVSLLGLALATAVTMIVWVDSDVILTHGHWPLIETLFNWLLGGLMGPTLVVCLAVIVQAVVGVLALPLAFVWMLASLLAFVAHGWEELCAALADQVVPHLIAVLAWPGKALVALLRWLWGAGRALPLVGGLLRSGDRASGDDINDDATDTAGLPPDEQGEARRAPPRGQRMGMVYQTSLLLVGDAGTRMGDLLVRACAGMGGKGLLLLMAYGILGQRPSRDMRRLITGMRATDVSLTHRELGVAAELSDGQAGFESAVLTQQCEKMARVMPPKASQDLLVVATGAQLVPQLARGLTRLRFALPRLQVLLLVEAAGLETPTPALRDGLEAIARYREEGVIVGALLVDPVGPAGGAVGSRRAMRLAVRTLAALLMARQQHPTNQTAAELLALLCSQSAYLAVSALSTGLQPGQGLSPLDPGAWATRQAPVGRGEMGDLRSRLREVLHLVATRASYRSIQAVPLAGVPKLAVCLFPLRRDDPRWPEVEESIEAAVRQEGPGAQSLLIAGNGVSDGGPGRYVCQCGLLEAVTLDLTAGASSDPLSRREVIPAPSSPAPLPTPVLPGAGGSRRRSKLQVM